MASDTSISPLMKDSSWCQTGDHARCYKAPPSRMWRGCIGLAAVFRDVDECECVGLRHVMYLADAVTWWCVRDMPENGGLVSYASSAAATLAYGMPRLNFAEPTAHVLRRA